MFSFLSRLYRLVGLDATHTPAAPSRAPDLLRRDFLDAMARAVSGVAVVTTDGPAGRRGLTVSTVTSVSADPPRLLVCIRAESPTAVALLENRRFCVNLLAPHHRELSDLCGGRRPPGAAGCLGDPVWQDRPEWPPVLTDAAASFDCVLRTTWREGTHLIFLGDCTDARVGSAVALLYSRRRYGVPDFNPDWPRPSETPGRFATADITSQGG